MKTYDHIIRFTLLIIVVILGFFIFRTYMVPDSFGIHGSYTYAYYRAESENEQANKPAVFQGTEHCSACHAPQAVTLSDGKHAALDCESCHGAFKAHNNNTRERMAISDSVETCMICHERLNARPTDFPQISSFAAHVAEQGETMLPDMNCTTCHDPHTPM